MVDAILKMVRAGRPELTAIKEVVTSRVAAKLMNLFGGVGGGVALQGGDEDFPRLLLGRFGNLPLVLQDHGAGLALQLGVESPSEDKLTLLGQLYQRLVKIYEQGRKAFQGTELDGVWLDEEPRSALHRSHRSFPWLSRCTPRVNRRSPSA